MRGSPLVRLRRRPDLVAALGYLALACLVAWPAVRHFRSRPMVDGIDSAVFEWAWWAMPRAVADGDNPLRTDLMFHPVGADLATTTTSPLLAVLTLPVQLLLGSAAQINTVQIGATFLAGFGCYLLAWHLCRDRQAAFVAGMVYALLPHRFVHVESHLNLVAVGLVPLAVLAFVRLVEASTVARAVALGAAVGATFLVDPQLAILAAMVIVVLAASWRERVKGLLPRLGLAGGTAAIVASPLLVPMALSLLAGEGGEPDPIGASLRYSSSPLSWVVPPFDRLWSWQAVDVEPLTWTSEGVAYVGLLASLLFLASFRVVSREVRRGWVAVAAVGFVLSLGPYLHLRDSYIDVPLPFVLFRAVPGLEAMRVPGRFAFVGALALCVLAACALAALAARHPGRRRWLLLGAGLVVLVDLVPASLPERPREVSPAYQAIADHARDGAVLELPLQWSTGQALYGFDSGQRRDFMFLANATVHGKPTTSGSVSRYSADRLDELLGIPVYRQLLTAAGEDGFDDRLTFSVADLRELDIGYVVHDTRDPVPAVADHLAELDLDVLWDDGVVTVWLVT